MLSPNTILRDRYRIIQLLGHGGMGAVYHAIDENLNRLVAVKEAFGSSDELRRAFRREAELLGNLRHRALPKSIEHFSENNSDYFVMEFVPGNDLGELLKLRGNPFPESDVLRWADEVLAVLAYLHGKGLVHRDIKPSNIKLTQEGELFLLDFGLAKGAAGQMGTLVTSQSVRGYTPAYASLEQILGQGTDARSDIYSVGATFYHLLAGVAPVDASTRFQKMDDEGQDPLPLIQHGNALVSPHVAGIIHNAMAINRRQRPESAEQMRTALQTAARESGPKIHPTTPPPNPPVSTIPAPQPKPHYWNTRMFTSDDAGPTPVDPTPIDPTPVDPSVILTPPRTSIAKVLLITAGVILLLVAASVGAVAVKTGWLPWRDKNLYDDGQTDAASNTNSNANTSPLVVTSPSPVKPTTQAPSAGTVVRNQIGMELVWIPPGSFMMGSDSGNDDEKPAHRVTFSSGFYLGKYEVTQDQWRTIMGSNPSYFPNCGGNCPVEYVTWDNVQQFINALNNRDTGFKYRLPSEAEWEYSARGGASGTYYWGEDLNRACRYENVSDQTTKSKYSGVNAFINCTDGYADVSPVGSFLPNGFGLYDIAGNVSEWCEDWYHFDHSGAPADGSVRGADHSPEKGIPLADGLYKGGWWGSDVARPADLRPAHRAAEVRSRRWNFIGFRLVAIPRSK